MKVCIFNPEHDLCLAKGRAHYVPPRSAVEFARRDAGIMQVLYGPAPIEFRKFPGDANNDKVVDAKDLTLIKREALGLGHGLESSFQTVDDDEWNGADARALVQKLTGEWDRPKRPYVFWLWFRPPTVV